MMQPTRSVAKTTYATKVGKSLFSVHRYAARGVATDYHLFRGRHGDRPGRRSGEGADQGVDRAFRGADLQGQGTRSGMMKHFQAKWAPVRVKKMRPNVISGAVP